MRLCLAAVLPAWFGLSVGRNRAGPSLHNCLCVPLGSSVVSQGEPPFALSLHLVFCGMLMQPILACAAALRCALGMRVPFGGAVQVPPAPGSGLRASICATLRIIRDSVRGAWPCTCPAGLFASSLSFVIHWAFFMERFASSLCSIFPLSSTFTPARCKLFLALCASSRSGSCCNGLPIASACCCTASRVQSHELKKAASAMVCDGAHKLHSPSGPGAETMLCSSSLNAVPTSASVVSQGAFKEFMCFLYCVA